MTCYTLSQLFVQHTKKMTYPQEKVSCFIPRFDPEGVMCVGIDVGGLNLEDVRWHSPVCLDAHVFVNNWRWETLTLGLRSADTATADTRELWQSLWNCTDSGTKKQNKTKHNIWCLLTFQRFWCKVPHRGFWDSNGSLHNSSSTFHHLDSYGSPSHTHLCLVIGRMAERERKSIHLTKNTWMTTFIPTNHANSVWVIKQSCETQFMSGHLQFRYSAVGL